LSKNEAFCVDGGIGNERSALRPFTLITVANCDFIYLLVVFVFNLLAEAASFDHYFSVLLFEHDEPVEKRFLESLYPQVYFPFSV
jgi:hypothetical protein